MTDQDELDAAERDAKLALLKQIKVLASNTNSGQTIERLAYAYALAVGALYGRLPGGPTDITVSK